MLAFIVRPFGTKTHQSESGAHQKVDFDKVERELILPALKRERIDGSTTLDIVHAGDIRTDMFHRLLTADVVIADLTMHNANVFYELGVRHALRKSNTIMISGGLDKHVFDLGPDRYMAYSLKSPAASVGDLARRIRSTVASGGVDSPVFRLNPGLKEPPIADFVLVPTRFTEDVESAVATRDAPLLALMAEELDGLPWAREGRRALGRAQRRIEDCKGSAHTWELVRAEVPEDVEASLELSTLYDRLNELPKSQQALARVIDVTSSKGEQAETEALIARNAKTVWRHEWESGATVEDRQKAALQSGYLLESAMRYERGFLRDLNHFYSGINALALYRVQQELAARHPEVWKARFETGKAEEALSELSRKVSRLSATEDQSLHAAEHREDPKAPDVWRIISQADYHLLTSGSAGFVKAQYTQARVITGRIKNDDRFAASAAARQLEMYLQLGVLEENAKAGLEAIGSPPPESKPQAIERVIVFAGHQVDPPGRKVRFPNGCEDKARQAIRARLQALLPASGPGPLLGFAGAASGGDILFHEVCQELGIETHVLVGLSEREHLREAVSPGGGPWVERYRKLAAARKPRFLTETNQLPPWLADRSDYNPLVRTSGWILKTALSRLARYYTLLALWDGGAARGTGGTADMVRLGQQDGFATDVIDTRELFGDELDKKAPPTRRRTTPRAGRPATPRV